MTSPYVRRDLRDSRPCRVALDPDTATSPETSDIALLAAGAAVDAVEKERWEKCCVGRVGVGCRVRAAWSSRRARKAHGVFAFFNNVARSYRGSRPHPRRSQGVASRRLATFIHGNGTQRTASKRDPNVLCVSNASVSLLPREPSCRLEVGVGEGEGLHDQLPARGRRRQRGLPDRLCPKSSSHRS